MTVRWNFNRGNRIIYEFPLKDEPLVLRVDKYAEPQFRSDELYIPETTINRGFTGTAYSILARRKDLRNGGVVSYLPLIKESSGNVVHLVRFFSGSDELERQEQIVLNKFFDVDLEYLIRGIIEFPIGSDFSLRLRDGI